VELKCFEQSQEEEKTGDSPQYAKLHKDASDGVKDCCIQLIGKHPL